MASDCIFTSISDTIPGGNPGTRDEVSVTFSDAVWNYFVANTNGIGGNICISSSLVSYDTADPHGTNDPQVQYQDSGGGWHNWISLLSILGGGFNGSTSFGSSVTNNFRQTMSFRLAVTQIPGFFRPRSFVGLSLCVSDTCGGFGSTGTMIAAVGAGTSGNVVLTGSGTARAGFGPGTAVTAISHGRAYGQVIGG